jgi:hypothetical protein
MFHAAGLLHFPEVFEKCSTGNVGFWLDVVLALRAGVGGQESGPGKEELPESVGFQLSIVHRT